MVQLHRVLYCSRNSIPGGAMAITAEIAAILAVSRANNERDGITGGLLFSDGCFAQVLEGSLPAIEATFERIQCDTRHGDVTILQSSPIASREFPDWSMAFAGSGPGHTDYSLAHVYSGLSDAGTEVLDRLRALVRREHEWLTPTHA